MYLHKTKDGRKIKLTDLEISHLENIIKCIKAKAKNGIVIKHGGGSCPDDFWYDEDLIHGKKVKKLLNYNEYKKELEKRQNKTL